MRSVRIVVLAVWPASASFLMSGAALAQEEAPPPSQVEPPRHLGGQRSFGLGPTIGFGAGSGATVTLALPPVGLWISGGYVPVLIFGNKRDSSRSLTFDAYSSAQVDFDVTVLPLHPNPRIDAGIIVGYRYNTVLSHGVGLGVALTYDLSRIVAVFLSAGLSIFPQAQDQLNGAGYPNDRDPSLPFLQGGGQAGLIFYP